ncbi:MAG: hypothetical protein GY822_06895 [Deltaproteobacteria bacterium]|nr:hypothetical protein [Deltaproteobacteria bacterium]
MTSYRRHRSKKIFSQLASFFWAVMGSIFFASSFLGCSAPNDGQVIRQLLREQAQLHGSQKPNQIAKRSLKYYQDAVFPFHPGLNDDVQDTIKAVLLSGGIASGKALLPKNASPYWRCFYAAQVVDLALFESACATFIGNAEQAGSHQIHALALLRQQGFHKGVDVTEALGRASSGCKTSNTTCLMSKWMHHDALQEKLDVADKVLRQNANLLGAIRSSHRFGPFSSMKNLSAASSAEGALQVHPGALPRYPIAAPNDARRRLVRRWGPLQRFHFSAREKKGWVVVPSGTLVFVNGERVSMTLRLNRYRAFHFQGGLKTSHFDLVTNDEKGERGAFFILDERLRPISTQHSSSLQELDYSAARPSKSILDKATDDDNIAVLLGKLSLASMGYGHREKEDPLENWMHAFNIAPNSQALQEALWHALNDDRVGWPQPVRHIWKRKLLALWATRKERSSIEFLEELHHLNSEAALSKLGIALETFPNDVSLRVEHLQRALALGRHDLVLEDIAEVSLATRTLQRVILLQEASAALGRNEEEIYWTRLLARWNSRQGKNELDVERGYQEDILMFLSAATTQEKLADVPLSQQTGPNTRNEEALQKRLVKKVLNDDTKAKRRRPWAALQKRLGYDFPDPLLKQKEKHGTFLRFEEEVYVLQGGGTVLITGLSIQFHSREGVEAFGKTATGWGEKILFAEAVNAQGVTSSVEQNASGAIEFSQLEAGSVLRLMRATVRDSGEKAPLRIVVQQSFVCLERRFSVFKHPDNDETGAAGTSLFLEKRDEMGVRFVDEVSFVERQTTPDQHSLVATLLWQDVEKIVREPFSPVDDRDLAQIVLAQSGTIEDELWTEASAAHHDDWAKTLLDKLDVSGNDEEKLTRIYHFVTEQIASAPSPSQARSVFWSGQGQRAPLFEKLLDVADIAIEPFDLVTPWNVETSGLVGAPPLRVLELPPAPWQGRFNSSYVSVVAGSSFVGDPPTRFRGSTNADGTLFSAPSYRDHSLSVDLELHPEKGSSSILQGVLWFRVSAIDAEAFRESLSGATRHEVRIGFESMLREQFSGIQVEDFESFNLSNQGTSIALQMRLKWEMPAPLKSKSLGPFFSIGTGAAFGVHPSWQDLSVLSERRRDLWIFPASSTLSVRIALPVGPFSFSQVPHSFRARAGPFEILQDIEVSDRTLRLQRIERASSAQISPKEWQKKLPNVIRLLSAMPIEIKLSRGSSTLARSAREEAARKPFGLSSEVAH